MQENLVKKKNSLLVAVAKGSSATRLSLLIMGGGQILRKQFTKGFLLFALQAAYVAFMILFGYKYLSLLFSGSLGTKLSGEIWNESTQVFDKVVGDNSFLILLYGVVTVVVSLLVLSIWRMNVLASYENDLRLQRGEKVSSFKEDIRSFAHEKFYIPLLLPPFLGVLVFTVMPLLFMVLIAFTNYDYNHMPPGKLFGWVGLENFKKMFLLSEGGGFAVAFLRVCAWTFIWAFFATFTNYFLGTCISLCINKKGIRFKKLWRTAFVIAIAVPQFVTLLLMQKVLDRSGILNVLLGKDILWLTDTRYGALLPKVSIILVNIWIGVPYTILMTTGLLMNVPKDYYEAARIDGANAVQAFFKITLPYMLQMTTPYLITQFVGNINNFNVIWLLTGGGPVDGLRFGNTKAQSTDLLVTWLYRLTTDANPQYNVASVIGIVLFVICASSSLIVFNRSSATKNEEAFQ